MDQTIRKLVLLYIVLIIASLASSFALESTLSPELQEYLANGMVESMSGVIAIAYVFLVVFVILHIISIAGLLLTKLWGKNMFIYSTIAAIFSSFFIGAYVDNAVAYSFEQSSMLVNGMIIALLIYNSSYTEAALKSDA